MQKSRSDVEKALFKCIIMHNKMDHCWAMLNKWLTFTCLHYAQQNASLLSNVKQMISIPEDNPPCSKETKCM